MDQCIYQKVSVIRICFLVLYVDDIFLATNDKGLLYEVKKFFSKNINIKDMGAASDSCHGRVSEINNILFPMFLLLS